MPLQIGTKAHSFAEPTGLLSDCHRRIEMFLASLERVGGVIDDPISGEARAALELSPRYFREAAPKHTADEEESLFPRLRQLGGPEVEASFTKLNALEDDHRRVNALHASVDALGQKCLKEGRLSVTEANQFRGAVAKLVSIYKGHIRIEDEEIFPVASRALTEEVKSAIALEMASRRQVSG